METQSNAKRFGISQHTFARWALMLGCLFGSTLAMAGQLSINVVGVGPTGATVTAPTGYRWTVEEDATKLSVPGQPANTSNYSFSFHTSYMPVVAAGRVGTQRNGVTQDPDVARLYAQALPEVCTATSTSKCLDPAKRYYVSIAAEGFQMGGAPVVFSGATGCLKGLGHPVPGIGMLAALLRDMRFDFFHLQRCVSQGGPCAY